MLYHYTDKISFARLRSDGVLRAKAMTLHQDLLAKDAGLMTPPIVWLTVSESPDPTVIASMIVAGWPREMAGNLYRICLPDDFAGAMSLDRWAESAEIDTVWLRRLIETGSLAGANWRDWRVVDRDIPSSQWTRREKFTRVGWQIIGG